MRVGERNYFILASSLFGTLVKVVSGQKAQFESVLQYLKNIALNDVKLNRIDLLFLAAGGVIFLLFVLDLTGTRILFNGDASSASFLLSTLTESLAALFAITFSVLIIAIEFSASKYTPKVLHFLLASIFKDFQIVGIIVFFISAMFVNFITLAHVSGATVPNDIRVFTSLSVALAAWSFLLIRKPIPSHSTVL